MHKEGKQTVYYLYVYINGCFHGLGSVL